MVATTDAQAECLNELFAYCKDGPLGPVPEKDNQDTVDSEQSLSVPDEDPTEDD